MTRNIIYSNKSSSDLLKRVEIDREGLEELGIHNNNIRLYIKGKYDRRSNRMGKSELANAWNFISLLILIGSIYALYKAIEGWFYGYIIFGFGILIFLFIQFSTMMTKKVRMLDPLNIKTKECINYAILKSIEFFTEQFSLIEVDQYIVDAFIQCHSIGIEKEFEEVKEIIKKYSLDDPKEEIMAGYLEEILNPIK